MKGRAITTKRRVSTLEFAMAVVAVAVAALVFLSTRLTGQMVQASRELEDIPERVQTLLTRAYIQLGQGIEAGESDRAVLRVRRSMRQAVALCSDTLDAAPAPEQSSNAELCRRLKEFKGEAIAYLRRLPGGTQASERLARLYADLSEDLKRRERVADRLVVERDAAIRRMNAGLAAGLFLLLAGMVVVLRRNRRIIEGQHEYMLAQERKFRSIVETTREWIWTLDLQGRLTYSNPALKDMLGYRPEDLVGKNCMHLLHPDDRSAVEQHVARRQGWTGLVVRWRHKDGSYRFLESHSLPVFDDSGALVGYNGADRDVTERTLLEEKLKHDALHDPLTGLANRTLLSDRLNHALARSDRTGLVHAVVFIDIDDFKTVNDSLGHDAGDLLLLEVARRIGSSLRSTDTAARLGGDEFAVLVEDVAGEAEARQVAERVIEELGSPVPLEGRDIFVHASAGIALGGPGRETAGDLLRNADVAMYEAKRGGKGRVELFVPAMQAAALTRLDRRAELRRALDGHELVLHFQPVVDLTTEQIVAAEALVRWDHPDLGLVPPSEFIAIAEESGLIVPLGREVVRQALARLAGWRRRWPDNPLRVSVNLSAVRFSHPDLVGELQVLLEEAKAPADGVVLEITETTLMQDAEVTASALEELRGLGVSIAIDDFGTGYSSLSYLRDFPIDMLKIDRSFLARAAGAEDSALAHAMLKLGQTLQLEVVAEGVESSENARSLRSIGCRYAQGFYFSPPVAADEFETFVERGLPRSRSGAALTAR